MSKKRENTVNKSGQGSASDDDLDDSEPIDSSPSQSTTNGKSDLLVGETSTLLH
jgi:hypothetical protein